MSEPVSLSVTPDGARGSIRLCRPSGNIVTDAMIGALDAVLDDLAARPRLKLVTLEGEGPEFSFGAAVAEHAPGVIEGVLPRAHRLIERLLDVAAPTAALVRGRCLGGGFELALACDFIFAETSATFGLPEIALGVFPPAASVLLPARVGSARATAAILTGAAASATVWQEAGLVTRVSADGALARDVDRWFAGALAGRSAAALRHAAAAARMTIKRDVGQLLPRLERLYLDGVMKTDDAREGVAAFLEKRPPQWNDR